MSGYSLCAQTEGKSKNTVAIITNSVSYLDDFLISKGLSTDVTQIGTSEIRTFISHLQQKKCFSNHPFSKAQQRGLSGHTINTYMRSIRAFWSWLIEEDIIVIFTVAVGHMILQESTLSFLGFGIPPLVPSWGAMVG